MKLSPQGVTDGDAIIRYQYENDPNKGVKIGGKGRTKTDPAVPGAKKDMAQAVQQWSTPWRKRKTRKIRRQGTA